MNGESNRKVIENYLLLLVSVYYNYLLLEDFDPLLLITGYYFENQSITYYFSITYYLLPHVCIAAAYTVGIEHGRYVIVAIPVPGPVSSQNRARRARFWLLTGRALVLPPSPTYRDPFPLYYMTYKHILVRIFALN